MIVKFSSERDVYQERAIMSKIKNIEKIPIEVRDIVEVGLGSALKKGTLGKMNIDFVQIENSLSGGKTGAVVLVKNC